MLLAVAVIPAAACGTVASPLPDSARPLAPATEPTLAPQASSSPAPGCGDRTATLRPPPELPRPGAVPAGSDLDSIVERDYLTVGVRPDTPPFGSLNPDTGEFEGFDVDIATLVAGKLFGEEGHVKFRAVTAAQRITLVQDGDLDMVTASVTVTCQRLTQVDFSAVYYLTSSGVLVLRDSPYHGLGDLGGRPVCAAAGTTSLQRIIEAPSDPVPYPVSNVTDCLVALQDGVVDGIVNDEMVLAGMADQDPRTHIVGTKTPFDEPIAAAISKEHPDLTRFVNGVLATAMADGTWKGIYEKWLGKDPPAPSPPDAHYRD